MGKLADPSLKLRCVHCGNTETPLWRAGPDGPKTLCNACGVRYKKGKLAIFKDSNGNLTAVKQENETPVHVPPAPKKSNKKQSHNTHNNSNNNTHIPNTIHSSPSSQQQQQQQQQHQRSSSSHTHHSPSAPDSNPPRRPVRKVPSEGVVTAVLAKKPRSRSRRTNAGQLPGRYTSRATSDDPSQWHSPLSSPRSYASSPLQSPKIDGGFPQLSRATAALRVDDPLPYQFDPSEEASFPDVSCLGIDSGDDDRTTVKLLPMAADPSSAEQFSFAFAELGNNAVVNIGLPDRVKALRALVLDRTRKVSSCYESTVVALGRLCEERHQRTKATDNCQPWTIEDCKNFVRWFAQEQNVGSFAGRSTSNNAGASSADADAMDMTAGFMLPEKTAYSSAVESFKALMDSTDLVGFAEGCMVELLCEDVALALSKGGLLAHNKGLPCRLSDASFPSKPISVRG